MLSAAPARRSHAVREVPRRAALSLATFRTDYLGADRPVVLAGAAAGWPAIARWTPDYLRQHARHATVNVRPRNDYGAAGSKRATTTEEVEIPFASVLGYLDSDGAPDLCYARQVGLLSLPRLAADVEEPRYLGTGLSQAWIGPGGTVTHLHWDPAHNLFAQVRGRKRVTLVAPQHAPRVSPNQISIAMLVGELGRRVPSAELRAIAAERPTSRHRLRELFDRLVTPAHRRLLYGLLAGINSYDTDIEADARVPRWVATLHPGDVLFIPFMWRHHVRALDPSISVNWFYAPAERSAAELDEVALDALCDHVTA